jgi:hypothetical protein
MIKISLEKSRLKGPFFLVRHFFMEIRMAMNYDSIMLQTLEKRVEDLERKVSELSTQIMDLRPRKKDWRSTVGTWEDDELTREAERFGREYRQAQK